MAGGEQIGNYIGFTNPERAEQIGGLRNPARQFCPIKGRGLVFGTGLQLKTDSRPVRKGIPCATKALINGFITPALFNRFFPLQPFNICQCGHFCHSVFSRLWPLFSMAFCTKHGAKCHLWQEAGPIFSPFKRKRAVTKLRYGPLEIG